MPKWSNSRGGPGCTPPHSVTESPGNSLAIALSSYHPIRLDRFGLGLQTRCFRRVVSVGLMVVVDKVFHLAAILFLTQSLCNVRSRISTSASAMISHTPVSRSPRIPFTMSDDFDTQCVFRDPLCDISPCKSWLASPSGFRSANRHRRQPHSADALISSIASVLSAIIGKASSIAAETDFLGHPSKPQFTKFLPGLEMRISHGV